MLKIVIVDDESTELKKIKTLVEEYARSRRIKQYSIETFTDPREFLNQFSSGRKAEIYILDIVMPGLSGIDLGAHMKRIHKDVSIIYLTSSEEYGVASYDVQAVDYLLKPCSPVRLKKALDRVLNAEQREQTLRFFIKVPDGVYVLPQREILYAEYYDHRLIVYTVDGRQIKSITQRKALAVLAEALLKEKNFLRISASVVVNMDHIVKLTRNEVEIVDGKKLQISRTYNDSRSVYLDYVLENN